jgi:hypothetical protein
MLLVKVKSIFSILNKENIIPKTKEKIDTLAAKNKHKMDPVPIPKREILLT